MMCTANLMRAEASMFGCVFFFKKSLGFLPGSSGAVSVFRFKGMLRSEGGESNYAYVEDKSSSLRMMIMLAAKMVLMWAPNAKIRSHSLRISERGG